MAADTWRARYWQPTAGWAVRTIEDSCRASLLLV